MPKLPDKTAFREITFITIEGICEDGVKRILMFSDFADLDIPLITINANYEEEKPQYRPQTYKLPPIAKNYNINFNLDCKGYKVGLIDVTNDETD